MLNTKDMKYFQTVVVTLNLNRIYRIIIKKKEQNNNQNSSKQNSLSFGQHLCKLVTFLKCVSIVQFICMVACVLFGNLNSNFDGMIKAFCRFNQLNWSRLLYNKMSIKTNCNYTREESFVQCFKWLLISSIHFNKYSKQNSLFEWLCASICLSIATITIASAHQTERSRWVSSTDQLKLITHR